MATPRRRDFTFWLQITLVVLGLSVSSLIVTRRLWSRLAPSPSASTPAPIEALPPSSAGGIDDGADAARQVTVFAIRAVSADPGIDPRLSSVKSQLRKILPNHGFELIRVQTDRLAPGESLSCDLGRGWRAATTLVPPSRDDFGRVRLRCELIEGTETRFTTLVDAPENQLFFYERTLGDDKHVLIGVGAR